MVISPPILMMERLIETLAGRGAVVQTMEGAVGEFLQREPAKGGRTAGVGVIALRMPLASDDQPDDCEEPRERGAPTQVVSSSP